MVVEGCPRRHAAVGGRNYFFKAARAETCGRRASGVSQQGVSDPKSNSLLTRPPPALAREFATKCERSLDGAERMPAETAGAVHTSRPCASFSPPEHAALPQRRGAIAWVEMMASMTCLYWKMIVGSVFRYLT